MKERLLLENDVILDRLSTKITQEVMDNKNLYDNTAVFVAFVIKSFPELCDDGGVLGLNFDWGDRYLVSFKVSYDDGVLSAVEINLEDEVIEKIYIDNTAKYIKSSNYNDVKSLYGSLREKTDDIKYEFVKMIDNKIEQLERQRLKKYHNSETIYKSVSAVENEIKDLDGEIESLEKKLEELKKDKEIKELLVNKALKLKMTIEQVKSLMR